MTSRMRRIAVFLMAGAWVTVADSPAGPAWQPLERVTNRYSGMSAGAYVAENIHVSISGVSSLQLRFGKLHLGQHSFVTITSRLDNAKQRLTARTMDQWGRATAWGDVSDLVELGS